MFINFNIIAVGVSAKGCIKYNEYEEFPIWLKKESNVDLDLIKKGSKYIMLKNIKNIGMPYLIPRISINFGKL